MNGGVYEPLVVRIARSYPITTVQLIVTGGFVTRLWRNGIRPRDADDQRFIHSAVHGMKAVRSRAEDTMELVSSRAFGAQELPGAPTVASSKLQPETATIWIQHRVNMA
jgi:hypothetical protein